MPIKKNQSHSEIVSELMSSYNKTGRIGNTSPRNAAHAEEIANAIAYKARHERILHEIKRINQKESLDYAGEISQKNLLELEFLVNKFKERYLYNETLRFKSGQVETDFNYTPDFIVCDKFAGMNVPVGYRCSISNLNLNSAESSVLSSENFDCMIVDDSLVIRPKSKLIDMLNGNVADLIFHDRI